MKIDIKNEKAEFACRVCEARMKENNPYMIGCAWRCIDGEYCEELEKCILEEQSKEGRENGST